MRKRNSRHSRNRILPRSYRPVLEQLETRTLLSAVQWINPSSGFWDVGSNWSTGTAPGGGDDAIINQPGVTVTIEAGSQAANSITASDPVMISGGSLQINATSSFNTGLNIESGTLILHGDATMAGESEWSSGGLNVFTHTITNSGTLTITSPSGSSFGIFANDGSSGGFTGSLVNTGTIIQQDVGPVNVFDNVQIDNQATGIYNFASDSSIALGNRSPMMTNAGTIKKTAGTGTSSIQIGFSNTGGTLQVDSGTLSLPSQGGTSTGGTFSVAQGATLDLTGGSNANIFTGAYTGSGVGQVTVAGGDIVIGSGGATFNFPAGFFQLTGGSLNLAGNNLTNAGSLTLANTGAVGIFANTLFSGGNGNIELGGQLINDGTILQGGNDVSLFDNVQIVNQMLGTYDFTGDGSIAVGNFSPLMVNQGIVKKTGGSGTSSISVPFNNQAGTVDAESGTLALAGGGTSTGGMINASSTGIVDLAGGGNPTFTGTYSGTGTGIVELATGEISVGAGGVTFNFAPGLFQWTGGAISTALGDLTNLGTITLAGASDKLFLNDGTLFNDGTIIQTGTGNLALHSDNQFATTLNIAAGGTYEIRSDSGISNNFGGITAVVNNGTIRKVSSSGVSNLLVNGTLTNNGTIDVESGTIALMANAVNSSSGAITVAQGATLDLTGGATTLYTGTYTATGAGTVTFSSGELVIGSAGATFNFPAGIFQWTAAGLDLYGHVLTNAGAMTLTNPNNYSIFANGFFSGGNGNTDLGGTLLNKGSMVLQTGVAINAFDSVQIDNEGTFTLASDGSILFGNDSPSLKNGGTLVKTGGTGTSTISVPVDNSGILEADSGTLALTSTVMQISANTLTAGTWSAAGSGTLSLPSGTSITTNQGNLSLNGAGASITGIAGLASNSGGFSLLGGATFSTSGDLQNSGTVTLGPASTLTVNGTYSQTSAGTLAIQFGGSPASGQFGKLHATGAANLAGSFAPSLANGFSPAPGDSFQAMTFASHTGNFGTISGPIFHRGAFLQTAVNAGNVTVTASTAVSDLAVTSVSFTPASATPGQNITVNYTVQNHGQATSVANWSDAIFLSVGTTIDASAILLGHASHSGVVAANGQYAGSLTASLPVLLVAAYHIIVEADSQGLVADANRDNNTLASISTLQATLPTLPLSHAGGTPTQIHGTFSNGQTRLFQLTVPAGDDLRIDAQITVPNATRIELLAAYNAIPTIANALSFSSLDDASVTLNSTQAGTYYVALVDQFGGSNDSFTLDAQELPFEVTGLSQTNASNLGPVTLTVTGDRFTPTTQVHLSAGTKTINGSVTFQNTTTLFATFNLLGATPGFYGLFASDNGVNAESFNSNFQILDGSPAPVPFFTQEDASIRGPFAVRPNRLSSLTIDYTAKGGGFITSVPAPLLLVSGPGAQFQIPGESGFVPDHILLLGINPNGPAGVLPALVQIQNVAGGGGDLPALGGGVTFTAGTQLTVNFEAPQDTTFTVGVADPNATIDWNSLKSLLQPAGVPNAAWDAIFANFTTEVGTTVGSLEAALDQDATYLSQLGEYTTDVNRLLEFQIEQAGDFGAIAQRYSPGIFGLGFPDGAFKAVTDAQGNVDIISESTIRPFTLQSDGSYQGVPGDFATLTLANGIYQLREPDGTLESFNPDGSLNFIQGTNGNKVSYGYTGVQLTSITDSATGDVTSLSYNSQGLVSQITDPEGRLTSLTYDSPGHLLSKTTPSGVTSYTYVTGQGPASENALASITNPNGSQALFTYNNQGQLLSESGNGGADALSYSYHLGAITVTDALNNPSTIFLDENEQVVEFIDPLGNFRKGTFNDQRELTELQLSGGFNVSVSYDSEGNPNHIVGPLGDQASASHNSFADIQSLTDPLGHTLNYSYDPATGDLLGITYPDGSSQQYAYNAVGDLTQFTNRDGQAIAYSYFPNGLLESETFPGGSQNTFTYDGHRNLASMTDSTGTTTFTYNSADRLTKVAYPDGTFLQYTYNAAGQRIQMLDQTGFTVNYQYDVLGRLAKLTDGASNLIASYGYDLVGQLTSKHFGNGTATLYTYDANGNPLTIVNLAQDGSTQSRYVYTYSHNLPVTLTTSAGTFHYGYDIENQLTSVQMPNGQTITYEYDAAGNRIAVNVNGTSTPYDTNNLNEYTQLGNTVYQYDANGDLVSSSGSTGTTTYRYNIVGQLVGATSSSGTTTYAYNALGQLVSETANGTVTHFLNDPTGPSNIVGDFTSGGSAIAHYTYGVGLASQVTDTGASNFYSFDASGNTTQLTGPNGGILNTYSYLPFGELLSSTGSNSNPFTYVGQFGVRSDANGLYFMRNRWYDPSLGRFTQTDPLRFAGGDVNLYRYVHNSPLRFVDPLGLQIEIFFGVPPIEEEGVGFVQPVGEVGPASGGTSALSPGTSAPAPAPAVEPPESATLADQMKLSQQEQASADAPPPPPPDTTNIGDEVSSDQAPSDGKVNPVNKTIEQTGQDIAQGRNPGGRPNRISNRLKDSGSPADPGGVASSLAPFFVTDQDVVVHTPHSHDPNEITGPAGFGSQGFVAGNQPLPYRIDFTNLASAAAPAQTVVVSQQLDPNLDLSTFQLGSMGFGNTIVNVPAGLTSFSTSMQVPSTALDAGPNGLIVQVTASLNPTTRLVTWTFTGIDPATGDTPIDPFVGFLPPDNASGVGEGFVSYTVQPKAGTPTGTTVAGQATVVFDTNAPISTKQISNTIDSATPTSTVTPLPAETGTADFTVSWSGSDAGSSGIASFSVFVSDNGALATPFLGNTTQTSATFHGQVGHTYGFFSIATDNVGNVEPLPTALQATTTVTALGEISGAVFQDININGKQDAGEPGMAGQTVFLDVNNSGTLQSGDPTTTTDANGNYQFTGLTPGTYTVRQVLLGGVLLDAPADNGIQVTVTGGANVTGSNFADVPASIAVPLTLPRTAPFPKQGNANADYVEAIYRAVLNRDAEAAGLAFWTNLLSNGTLSRLQVVQGIRTSPEHFTQEVTDFYFTLLGRAPDVPGLQFWVQALQSGLPEEQMAFNFLDSPEYLSKGDKFFIDHMYLSLLGRAFDASGEVFWLNQLGDDASGSSTHAATLTHEQVITAFLRSPESLNRLVEGYYQIFLQRLADAQGLNFWLAGLQAGQSFLTIGQDFLTSNEFYNNAAAEG